MSNIVFLGIKHCGKSTQGKLLAEKLKRDFLDSDQMLEKAYMEKYSCSAAESTARAIMQKHGEEFFRRFEAGVIRDFLQQQRAGDCVLALGGGVPCNTFLSDEELKSLGTMVFLNVAPETAYKRIIAGGIPPFLQGSDPHEKFLAMYEKRTPRYCELADIAIDVPEDGEAAVLAEKVYNCLLDKSLV